MQMLSKVAIVAGLAPAVLASSWPASYSTPESAPTSSDPAPVASSPPASSWGPDGSSSPAPVSWVPSSSSAPVPASWGPSSSAPVYSSPASVSWGPSGSSSPVAPVSGSASWSGSSVPSSTVPSATPTPTCWSACFVKGGITSEREVCGNTEVDQCIHDTCCKEEDEAYWSWYDGYCGAPSSSVPVSPASSSGIPSYPSGSSSPVSPVSSSGVPSYPTGSSSVSASATPTPSCWSACFQEAGITAESQLCGNTQVDKCIQDTCSAAEDKAYWAWYESYCTTASGSASSPVSPASTVPYYGASSWVVTSTSVVDATSTVYITNTVYAHKPSAWVAPSGDPGAGWSSTKTYTVQSTSTITDTITVYPASSSAGAVGCGSGATVTVTETEAVTVTVGGGSGSGIGGGHSVAPVHSSGPNHYASWAIPTKPTSTGWAAPSGFSSVYGSSVPAYPAGSSADPASSSAAWSAPAYPSGSSVSPASGSSSVSIPAYPSGTSVAPVSGSATWSSAPGYPAPSASTPVDPVSSVPVYPGTSSDPVSPVTSAPAYTSTTYAYSPSSAPAGYPRV